VSPAGRRRTSTAAVLYGGASLAGRSADTTEA
jgi:hypothetical protein